MARELKFYHPNFDDDKLLRIDKDMGWPICVNSKFRSENWRMNAVLPYVPWQEKISFIIRTFSTNIQIDLLSFVQCCKKI